MDNYWIYYAYIFKINIYGPYLHQLIILYPLWPVNLLLLRAQRVHWSSGTSSSVSLDHYRTWWGQPKRRWTADIKRIASRCRIYWCRCRGKNRSLGWKLRSQVSKCSGNKEKRIAIIKVLCETFFILLYSKVVFSNFI